MHNKISLALVLAVASLAIGPVAHAQDAQPDASPQAREARMNAALQDARSGKPPADESVGTRIKRDAREAGHAISNGAHRAGHAIAHAASATGHAISNGVHRTGAAIHNATHRHGGAEGHPASASGS